MSESLNMDYDRCKQIESGRNSISMMYLWSSGQSSGYRSRGPGSIPGATRFSQK
jgi:hypothetical protein